MKTLIRHASPLYAVGIAFMFFAGVSIASAAMLTTFTESELKNNWEADRFFPTDDVLSVTAFGRDDVAQISLDSTKTQPGTFQRTEGIKTVGAQNFGTKVEVDLYVDPDWEDQATRAGFWVVGDDGSGGRDNWFGIIEFVNIEPSSSGVSAQGDHEGWRFWDSVNGWTNLSTDFTYGEWARLTIELDTETAEYHFLINRDEVGVGPAGENFIREIFLNSYNYGLDEFPNLGNGDYGAHWHAGFGDPTEKAECKKDGWMDFGFKNQGQCVRYIESNENSGKKEDKKELVETLTVYANDSDGATSNVSLEEGEDYLIVVSGVAFAGDGIEFDAKYSDRNNSGSWTDSVQNYEVYGSTLLDLQIDGASPDWGTYNSSHEYNLNWDGDGSSLNFAIYDTYYPNNTGSLTVKIYEL